MVQNCVQKTFKTYIWRFVFFNFSKNELSLNTYCRGVSKNVNRFVKIQRNIIYKNHYFIIVIKLI